MLLTLQRKIFNETSCEGNLLIDGEWFCHTIEDKVRAKPNEWKKELKVHGKTAIPYGKYPVLVTWSNRFNRLLTGIFNVPDFEGIRLHNGTSDKSSEGCIILSYKNDAANHKLINDKGAMNDLCKKISAAQKTQKVYIEIV